MKEIKYGVREIATKKIVLTEMKEKNAVQICGKLNRRHNAEKFEIVKIITTVEIEEVAQKGENKMTSTKRKLNGLTVGELKELLKDIDNTIEISVWSDVAASKIELEIIKYNNIETDVDINIEM